MKQSLKNEIIKEFIPFVSYLAGRVYRNNLGNCRKEELIEAGIMGLIEAIEGFKTINKEKFETYASYKIKDAIFEHIKITTKK